MLQRNIMYFIIDIIDACANSGNQALLSPEGLGYEAWLYICSKMLGINHWVKSNISLL